MGDMLEDRQRLARDIHDGVLQSLYAIGLSIEAARRSRDGMFPRETSSGNLIDDQLNHLIHEVRSLIRSLESRNVQGFDLRGNLELLIRTYRQISLLKISTSVSPGIAGMVTHEEQRGVLMIVREAISNCVRHARAVHASVSLYTSGRRLRLLVADDGIGFAPEHGRSRGYGLANMSARARKLGGRLLIRSQTGEGTRILVEIALGQEPPAV